MNENKKYNIPKLMVHGKNGANREIFTYKHVKKKTRNVSNQQSNFAT